MPDRLNQYSKNPQGAGDRPSRPNVSPKSQEIATQLRNKLVPDTDPDVMYPGTPTTNSFDGAKGGNPGGTQAVPGPRALPIDNNRVPGKSGDAGPM